MAFTTENRHMASNSQGSSINGSFLFSFKWVPTPQRSLAKAHETRIELRSNRHMQLRTAFLKSSALRGFKNGDGKASKNGEAKGCVEGRNLRRRRARSTSAAAGRAPASDADIPASSSSHSFSENTTVTTLTPQSSQGVPSPCRDQDGSLLPSLPPLPPLPLTGRYLTPGTPERGKSAPPTSFCRGSRRGDRGLEDAPDSGRAYGGGGVGRESVLDREDTSVEEKVDELLSEMSDLLVGEREHRYGVDGDSCVVELLDESSDDSDFDWLERVRSFYASEDCCVPATKKPDNPYEAYRVRQERARASHEACEGVGGKEASSAMGNSMKASVRRNRDVVEPESVHGGLTSSSLARAQETEQRAKSVFMRWPEGTRKEVGEEGHRTWWSRLRNGSDGSAASVGSGGFFGQALSALAAATSFDASLQAPTVTPGSSRASREGTNDWDAAGGRSRSGGGGSGSRTTARERETSITENVSDRRCDQSLIKGVAVPNARIDKAGGTADRGAGVVTVLKRQAGEEGEQSRMTGIKQQAALVASMRDCETPSRSRRLLLESPFFRKAKGLSDLKKILGTEELREGFRQFLSKRWCAENIDFIEQVMRYQEGVRREGGANGDVLGLSRTIEATFLLKGSPKEVNIGQDMRVACLKRRARDEKHGVAAVDTFDIVAFELLSMMAHTSLRDFQASAHYATIEACLELGPRESRNSVATSNATFFDEEEEGEDIDDGAYLDRPCYSWSRATSDE